MTAPAAPADVKDDLLLQIRRLLDKSKPELQKEWKKVDCSDFEPVAKLDLLAAILCRLLLEAGDLASAQSQPSSSTCLLHHRRELQHLPKASRKLLLLPPDLLTATTMTTGWQKSSSRSRNTSKGCLQCARDYRKRRLWS